jgi:hypothetical protein
VQTCVQEASDLATPFESESIFKPNRVDTPSATRILAQERGLPLAPTPPDRELRARAIRLQLRNVQVLDGLQGLWGTSIGDATGVYLITTVIDGTDQEPISFQGKTYENITNGDVLPLGPAHEPDSVFNVYLREGNMPRFLSFSVVVFRSNQAMRDLAKVIVDLRADERYETLSGIVKTAATAANPVFGIAWQAAEAIVGLVAQYLNAKPDDQLGYYQANYTNAFDNLGVGRHPAEAATMTVDRIRFAYEINALSGD